MYNPIRKPIKNDISNYGINFKKIIQQSSHNKSFHVPCWETHPIKMEQLFAGFEEDFYGFGLGEVEMIWVWVMGVTLVKE
jgi:hypothetical protein